MNKLALMRRLRRMTQVQLAQQIGFHQSDLSELENGKFPADKVRPEIKQALETVFERPFDSLLEPLQP